jgi:hypothetical protein
MRQACFVPANVAGDFDERLRFVQQLAAESVEK